MRQLRLMMPTTLPASASSAGRGASEQQQLTAHARQPGEWQGEHLPAARHKQLPSSHSRITSQQAPQARDKAPRLPDALLPPPCPWPAPVGRLPPLPAAEASSPYCSAGSTCGMCGSGGRTWCVSSVWTRGVNIQRKASHGLPDEPSKLENHPSATPQLTCAM